MITVENTNGTINTYSNFGCNHINIEQNKREDWGCANILFLENYVCAARRRFF